MAIVRIGVTLPIAFALIGLGFEGWSGLVWLWGGVILALVTFILKGYWQPVAYRSVVSVAGLGGVIMIVVLIPLFNFALAASLHGLGVLLGLAVRAIT